MPPIETPSGRGRACLLTAVIGSLIAACLSLTCGGGLFLALAMLTADPADPPTVAAAVTAAPPTPLGTTATPFPPTLTSTPLPGSNIELPPTATPPAAAAATIPAPRFPVPGAVEQAPIPAAAYDLAALLLRTEFPAHDYYDSARRLTRRELGPRVVPAGPYRLGDTQTFITDQGTTTATLGAITDSAYFWVEEGLVLDPQLLTEAAQRMDQEYYPLVSGLFGNEWRPGVDGDSRYSVLHLSSFAGSELGFFDSSDEYPQTVAGASNEQEIFYLNMEALELASPLYFGTLVHELQHMIQWYVDGNETVWLDEGLAQLAELYVGLYTADTYDYADQPDIRLTGWSYDDSDAVYVHYAASYLFSVYLWEQLGESAIAELSRNMANGMQAVNAVLAGYRPETSLADFVSDWAVANWLDGLSSDPRYSYGSLDLDRPVLAAELTRGAGTVERINQFGTDYVNLDWRGPGTLTFAGDTLTPLLPVAPHSGETMWFVPAVDNIDARLSANFDLRSVSSATLSFQAWYDLEEGYDFTYLSVSADGGASWDLLLPVHSTAGDYGPAFGGQSNAVAGHVNGWVTERIALNSYVGQQITVRFEMLTDGGVQSRGFAVDDIAIAELGYVNDVERDDGIWQANGFVRGGSALPQVWRLRLIDNESGAVQDLSLDARNQEQWEITLGSRGGTLVISALSPFGIDPATYWLDAR